MSETRERLPRRLAVILYADVAGYSRLTGDDEDATHRVLGEYLDVIAADTAKFGGQVVHYAGDAVLARFDAASDALSAALAIQRELGRRNQRRAGEREVAFRIGVNLGDVIEDRGDIYGDGVNVAARLESLAEPGGICVSEAVRKAVGSGHGLRFVDMGDREVKNIDEPVRAYAVAVDDGAPPAATGAASGVLHFEVFELDEAARELRSNGELVPVEPQVFDVLAYLVRNGERAVPRDELLSELWGHSHVTDSALSSRIKLARRAIGDDGKAQRLIRTVHGHGFRFVGELTGGAVAAPPVAVRSAPPPEPVKAPALALSIAVDDEFTFVGRQGEVEHLWPVLSAPEPRPGAVLVGGVAGVGKSRLAIQLAERAALECRAMVCAGRCDENMAAPFAPWADALCQLALAGAERLAEWGRGIEPELLAVAPALGAWLGAGDTGRDSSDQFVQMDAVLTLLDRATAQAPLLVLIDDVHWSDEPTRALCSRALRRLSHRPVRIALTFRNNAPDLPGEVKRWLSSLARAPHVERVELEGLDAGAVAELSTSVLGPQRVAALGERLFERTHGHGLFVTETLRDCLAGGDASGLPPSMTDIVEGRLQSIEHAARRFVTAAAALGQEFAVATAATASGLDLEAALEAADAAIHADLMHSSQRADRLRFSHQLVPAAVVESLTAPARARLHRDCANALEQHAAHPVEVATHRLDSIPLMSRDEAVEQAVAAASAANAAREYDRAIRLFEKTLSLDVDERTRATLLLALARALTDAGRVPEALAPTDEVAAMARRAGWRDLLIEAALWRGGRSPYRNVTDTGTLELLDELLADEDQLDRITLAKLKGRKAAFSVFTARLAERDRISAEALALGEDAAPSDLHELLEARWAALGCPLCTEQLHELDQRLEAVRAVTNLAGSDVGMPDSVAYWTGDGDSLRAQSQLYVTDPRSRRQIDLWRHRTLSASLAVMEGRVDEARVLFDEAGAMGRACWGDSGPILHALGKFFCDVVEDSAGKAALQLMALHDAAQSPLTACNAAWAMYRCGEHAKARALLDSVRRESLHWFPEHIVGGHSLIAAGELAVALDDDEWASEAEAVLQRLGSVVIGVAWAPSLAAADTLERLASRRGDKAAAAAWRDQALTLYQRLGATALIERLEAR